MNSEGKYRTVRELGVSITEEFVKPANAYEMERIFSKTTNRWPSIALKRLY